MWFHVAVVCLFVCLFILFIVYYCILFVLSFWVCTSYTKYLQYFVAIFIMMYPPWVCCVLWLVLAGIQRQLLWMVVMTTALDGHTHAHCLLCYCSFPIIYNGVCWRFYLLVYIAYFTLLPQLDPYPLVSLLLLIAQRFILSLTSCAKCMVIDDQLNILPISSHTMVITRVPPKPKVGLRICLATYYDEYRISQNVSDQ